MCSIYGSDWEYNADRVMRELGIDRIRYEVMIQTPRRFGKTVSVSMYVLAVRGTNIDASPHSSCILALLCTAFTARGGWADLSWVVVLSVSVVCLCYYVDAPECTFD